MGYRLISENFWIDSVTGNLNFKSKFLFLYLLTNRHSHFSGLYYLPPELIRVETKISSKEIRKAINDLEGKNLIQFDSENSIFWIDSMLNCYANSENSLNPKQKLGILRHVNSLPHSTLTNKLLKLLRGKDTPIDTPTDNPIDSPMHTTIDTMEMELKREIGNEKEKQTLTPFSSSKGKTPDGYEFVGTLADQKTIPKSFSEQGRREYLNKQKKEMGW